MNDVQFEPLPQLPFLRFFVSPETQGDLPPDPEPGQELKEDPDSNEPGFVKTISTDGFPILFQSYTTRFSMHSKFSIKELRQARASLSSLSMGQRTNAYSEGVSELIEEQRDENVIVVDYNPKNCILSDPLFSSIDYKDDLIDLIMGRLKRTTGKLYRHLIFAKKCEEVEVLVLDPMPQELRHIFLEPPNKASAPSASSNNVERQSSGTRRISFRAVLKVFPNVKDLFLRETTLNMKPCYDLKRFIESSKGKVTLERIFFSKEKRMQRNDIANEFLKKIGWEFMPYEQSMMNVLK